MGPFKGADEQQACTGERVSAVSRDGDRLVMPGTWVAVRLAVGSKGTKKLSLEVPGTGGEGRHERSPV